MQAEQIQTEQPSASTSASTSAPTIESEEERLKNMTEEEQLEYLAGLDAKRRQEILKILENLLSSVQWNSFSTKYYATQPQSQSSYSYLQQPSAPTPTSSSKTDKERIEREAKQQHEEDMLRKQQQTIKLVNYQEQDQAYIQASRRARTDFVYGAKPDMAQKMNADLMAIMNMPRVERVYKGEFAKYDSQFAIGNKALLHDAGSSVPFKGQVMLNTTSQTAFAIDQGQKLEDILKKQGVSPLNSSPADQAILKRASAAKREQELQRLDRTETSMINSEEKLRQSISDFRNGILGKALPDMTAAKNPSEVKAAFQSAMSSGLINQAEVHASVKDIGKNLIEYSKAVADHAKNLVYDGQGNNANDLIDSFSAKSKKMAGNGFLNEISNNGFSEKIKEMSDKMPAMVSSLTVRSGPQLKPE